MLQILPHLKTREEFINKKDISHSNKVVECFKKACINLDAGIFEPLMQEDDIFEDKDKYKFLNSLKVLFAEYRDENTVSYQVSVSDDICNGCNLGKPVNNFRVFAIKKDLNKPGRLFGYGQFAFLIEFENGILRDIYRCNASLSKSK